MLKQSFWIGFLSFKAGMIDRLFGKTKKRNQEEFVLYVEFVFVLIILSK